MNYCSNCGTPISQRIPEGDDRLRYVCSNCHMVHYQNPKVVVGCIANWRNKILLCRRAIEPSYGLWTVPAGFMENGETTYEGALRETLEEANAHARAEGLYMMINLPQINQVYLLFRAELLDLDFSPGKESLDTKLHSESEIPWGQLAFPSVEVALQHYFADQKAGQYQQRMADIMHDRTDHASYQVSYLSDTPV